MDFLPGIARWLHIIFGITWIGLLYYFNLVQMAALKDAGADGTAAGITKHVAPRALFYFRWAAVGTWLAGAWLLGAGFMDAFLLRNGMAGIGIGAWLGTIMLINVWHPFVRRLSSASNSAWKTDRSTFWCFSMRKLKPQGVARTSLSTSPRVSMNPASKSHLVTSR